MNDGRTSPRRRHILSSINPEDEASSSFIERLQARFSPSPSPSPSPPPPPRSSRDGAAEGEADKHASDDPTRPRRSRLKLKGDRSSRSHRSSRRHRSREHREGESSRRHRHRSRDETHGARDQSPRRHRHHHRRRGRSRSPTPPNPYEPEPLDPEAAFRESLFDAMADDEGAAYWEGVYGQPVHTYEQDKVGPQGELERMTDEEYVAYVRQKMWEKTHAGLLEERARREERRKKAEEEARYTRKLRAEMDDSLRRGEQRRTKRRWAQRWEDYATAWANWDGAVKTMAWPWPDGVAKRAAGWGVVEDGTEEEVDVDAVREFFIHGLAADEIGEAAFAAKLRDERVRWHPDKIQQRLGGAVDDKVLKDVTAIFQIIDRLWADVRGKSAA